MAHSSSQMCLDWLTLCFLNYEPGPALENQGISLVCIPISLEKLEDLVTVGPHSHMVTS